MLISDFLEDSFAKLYFIFTFTTTGSVWDYKVGAYTLEII
jgi:hypothetical protein